MPGRARRRRSRSDTPARRSGNVRVRCGEHVHVPRLRDRRQERPGHDRVDPHLGPSAWAKPTVMAFTPALAAAYGTMSPVGRTAPGARHVDDRAAGRPRPSARRRGPQPERAFQVDADHLVEQLLGDVGQLAYMRRDAGVVDQHVDPAEIAIDVLDEPLELVPAPDVARAGRAPARPVLAAAAATSSQASALRLTMTTSAPACAKALARSRGRDRGCRR